MSSKDKDKDNLTAEDFQHALQELGTFIDVTVDDLLQINQMAHKHAELRQTEQTLIRDIMTTDVTCATLDTPLRDAARTLLELRISGLPVLDENKKLVGVVTEADFLGAMGIPSHHPAHSLWQTLETMFRHKTESVMMPETVGDIMHPNVVTISEDKTLHEAIDTMKKHHIKRLIVTDAGNRVVGMLTRSNLIQVLLKNIL